MTGVQTCALPIFKTDTSSKDLSVSFSLQLKDSIPKNALTVYRINDVFINQNYTLRDGRRGAQEDTTLFKDYIFKGKEAEMNIRPSVILRSIYFRKNEVYSRQKHNMTLNRLMSMGTFKFVQVKFSDSQTSNEGLLDVTILLTTMKNK